jgi:hypothetical protein
MSAVHLRFNREVFTQNRPVLLVKLCERRPVHNDDRQDVGHQANPRPRS